MNGGDALAQRIFGMGLGGSGIVGVLIATGIILCITQVNEIVGTLALVGGVAIGFALGILGVLGVLSRLHI
ncbi:MAG: hypothetical protein QMD46_10890 [Methanomicrobiales archaeon]|nr:hypothetical protein [Methanomicrobiales archaeon]MDI6877030.1 hypothetical protein [Methanomicrobiales archaeon]